MSIPKTSSLGKPRKGAYALPNLITTTGLLAGFSAIIFAAASNFHDAAIAIFIAIGMDILDGKVARATKTSSEFGKEYDSLVDVVAFGLAPALLVYEWGLETLGQLGWLVSFIFLGATAVRLARFNSRTAKDHRYFEGLPCPMAAAIVASFIWMADAYQIESEGIELLTLWVVLGIAVCMASSFPYRSFKDIDGGSASSFIALFVLFLLLTISSLYLPWILLVLSVTYCASGPLKWIGYRLRGLPE